MYLVSIIPLAQLIKSISPGMSVRIGVSVDSGVGDQPRVGPSTTVTTPPHPLHSSPHTSPGHNINLSTQCNTTTCRG